MKNIFTWPIKFGIIVSFFLLLMPTFTAHVYTWAVVDQPVLLEEGTATAEIQAEWKSLEAEQSADSIAISQEWVDYMSVHQPDEDAWVDYEYWQNYFANSAKSASHSFWSGVDYLSNSVRSGLAWSEDSSVKPINAAKEKYYQTKVWLTFPFAKGVSWILGILLFTWLVIVVMRRALNKGTMGMYDKAKAGADQVKRIPIPYLATIISLVVLSGEVYIAYKIGLVNLIYWAAGLPDVADWGYDACGWTILDHIYGPISVIFTISLILYMIYYKIYERFEFLLHRS